MPVDSALKPAAHQGLWQIEDVLDAAGNVALPPAITLISLIERNIANVGDTVAYRYLDHTRSEGGFAHELTWSGLGTRMRAIGAEVQRFTSRGDRVAVLAPQGLDYVAGFSPRSRRAPLPCLCSHPSWRAMRNGSRSHCTTRAQPSC